MPPGGARSSKRVRPTPPNERPSEDIPLDEAIQAKRARQCTSNERPRAITTRSSSTRPQLTETMDQVQQELPHVAEDDNGLHSPREYSYDWSYDGDYDCNTLGVCHYLDPRS